MNRLKMGLYRFSIFGESSQNTLTFKYMETRKNGHRSDGYRKFFILSTIIENFCAKVNKALINYTYKSRQKSTL